jgi:hypothetical protein
MLPGSHLAFDFICFRSFFINNLGDAHSNDQLLHDFASPLPVRKNRFFSRSFANDRGQW